MLYSNTAFRPSIYQTIRMGTTTEPNYLFGSLDSKTEPWVFAINNVAISANVAIVQATLRQGGGASPLVAPRVGAKMGIRGTTTNGGIFNVDPTAVSTVTWTPSTGAIAVTFPLTHADVGAITDTGDLIIQPYETADLTGTSAGAASAPVALIFSPDESDNSRCLFAEVRWTGTLPTAATVVLQVANVDDDGYGASPVSRWQTVQNAYGTLQGGSTIVAQSANLGVIAGSAVTQSGAMYQFLMGKFIRAKITALTGADATTGIICSVFA